jgi:hypothetical protein
MRIVIVALALLLAQPGFAAAGGDRPDFNDRPTVGQPLRFTDSRGNVFRPRVLYLVTRSGTLAAHLPAATDDARSEDHLDLSGTPLIGQLFRGRIAPSDAARDGAPIGPVLRLGDALVLDARETTVQLDERNLVLNANLPRDGVLSYHLGRLTFAPGNLPGGTGTPAGTAYLVNDTLVLAGDGRGPLITDWSKVFGGGN